MTESPYRSRLDAVRDLMRRKGADALIVPSADPHLGEYVPDHWRIIRWLTGFTGSAATVIVTDDFAGLWTDSRYFLQAAEQLEGSGFELVKLKVPHSHEHIEWLGNRLKKGSRVAVDGRLISASHIELLQEQLKAKNIRLTLKTDFIAPLWKDRPPLPGGMAFAHPLQYAGESRADKISRVRQKMNEMKAGYQLLTSCDEVMWLLNIRGSDLGYSPLMLSFAIVSTDQVLFFADEEKIPEAMKADFDSDNVVLLPYDLLEVVLGALPEKSSLLLSPSTTSAAILSAVPKTVAITREISIPARLKAIRNETEIRNLRDVMIKDGIALTRFFYWLGKNVGSGEVTELSASAMLESFRMEQEGYRGPSFETIAAYGSHAALPHYVPGHGSDAKLKASGIFLLDSGGQYPGGTTDVTRTIALSEPDDEMRRYFTLALKGTIDLAMIRFPYGTRGYQIEVLARKALWENGMNYGHGTGHGVGSFLNVHEGPQTIGSAASGDIKTILEPGMLTSDEPAVYREGSYGFRTENLILCVNDSETDYGRYLSFETVTLCYIDRNLTDASLLDDNELQWLNEYHERVYNLLEKELNTEERGWLRENTAPIGRENS